MMMKRAAADAVKGKGVAAQQRYHKEFLECRVQLQQVLEGSNRMPEVQPAAASHCVQRSCTAVLKLPAAVHWSYAA